MDHNTSEDVSREIEQRFTDDIALTQAVREAIHQAVHNHIQAGNPIAAYRHGEVTLLVGNDPLKPNKDAFLQQTALQGIELVAEEG